MASAPVSLTQFDLMSRALDTEFGIIEQVSRMGLQPGESDLHYAVAVSQNPSAISPHSRNTPLPRADRQAAGAGMGWDAALWSTLGESLERYSASIIEPDSIMIAKAEDLEGLILSPLDFILFGEEQYNRPDFPYAKWTPQDVFAWTKTMRFVTGEELWVPADFVYLAHAGGNPRRLDKGYSTGLGAHRIPALAATTAIKELVERDAYIGRFLVGARPPRIPPSILRKVVGRAVERLEQNGLELLCFDLTSDVGLPTALCHIVLPDGLGIASGASCQVSPMAAIKKAATECLHTFNWLIDMNRWPVETALEDIHDFVDHVSYHRNLEAVAEYSRFLSGPEGAPMMEVAPFAGSPKEELEHIIAAVENAGHKIYLSDVTSSDIADLGFTVFRSIAPTLQPMYAGGDAQHLDRRRLRQIAKFNGLEWSESLINLNPHPFP